MNFIFLLLTIKVGTLYEDIYPSKKRPPIILEVVFNSSFESFQNIVICMNLIVLLNLSIMTNVELDSPYFNKLVIKSMEIFL